VAGIDGLVFSSDLKVASWESQLENDPDREFLMDGIRSGFKVVDEVVDVVRVESKNFTYPRTLQVKIEKQIQEELSNGRYVITKEKPHICSPLMAIEKPDGSARIIHNASFPKGLSLNDYARLDYKAHYESVRDALQHVRLNSFCSKIDLKSAYRSVGIHPTQFPLCGLSWKFEGDAEVSYLVDRRLMMGARKAPSIFHRLSQAVKRIMCREGYTVVVYLDDFLVIENSYDKCREGQLRLIRLLRDLGFSIAWPKVTGPSNVVTFLGVEINTAEMSVALPEDKVHDLIELLHSFNNMSRASCKQLQRLAGKLNWASSVIPGGRSYLRRILDVLAPLRLNDHKARLSDDFKADLAWWLAALSGGVKKSILVNPPVHMVYSDACDSGGGFCHQGDWAYVNWAVDFPEVPKRHINYYETIVAVLAARRWAHLWCNSRVIFFTDNVTARANLAKGTCKDSTLMPWLRELAYYACLYNFEIGSEWIPGQENIVADAISRLDSTGHILLVLSYLGVTNLCTLTKFVNGLPDHVSYSVFCDLYRGFTASFGAGT